MANTTAVWRGDMAFEMELQGHRFFVDADESVGGKNRGPRPKALMLTALAGCTGMDVVSILNKMRMPFSRFELRVEGEVTDEHPKVYNEVTVVYAFWGNELDREKIEKAITLSQERYCGVAATLKHTAALRFEIELNPE